MIKYFEINKKAIQRDSRKGKQLSKKFFVKPEDMIGILSETNSEIFSINKKLAFAS